jgi:hypothetical protein
MSLLQLRSIDIAGHPEIEAQAVERRCQGEHELNVLVLLRAPEAHDEGACRPLGEPRPRRRPILRVIAAVVRHDDLRPRRHAVVNQVLARQPRHGRNARGPAAQ